MFETEQQDQQKQLNELKALKLEKITELVRQLYGEAVRDSVPDARLEILSPAAHLANVERPEAATKAILRHLQAALREGT